MEKQSSKKALRSLIEDSLQSALKNLALPEAGKKAKKVIRRDSKKLAAIFSDALKSETKKRKKAAQFMERAVKGKKKKEKKNPVELTAEAAG